MASLDAATRALAAHDPAMRKALGKPLREQLQPFAYLFPDLQNPADLLPESPDTVAGLKELGDKMSDPAGPLGQGDSGIPAIYTYFGQFVDHDITLEATPEASITAPDLAPLPLEEILGNTFNQRTSAADLDSVYGQGPDEQDGLVPYESDRLKVGKVSAMPPPFNTGAIPFQRPSRAIGDDFNDLPREPKSPDITMDRAARIGDPRNDENTIVAQLHTAFLRAHNALLDGPGSNFKKARKTLRQHYQHIIVHDYLKRIADPVIVDSVIDRNRVYEPGRDLFMPIEFAFGAYRFGHTMARNSYDFNVNFNLDGPPAFPASFALLFTFTALKGNFGDPPNQTSGTDTLPENWIVEWDRLVTGTNPGGTARRLDTRLADPGLFNIPNVDGSMPPGDILRHLARRNLLRGYLFRLPTGQAVARKLGLPPLTRNDLQQAVTPDEFAILDARGFVDRTPLWYYVLAEASAQGDGKRLGDVGSTIVAEVLVGLVRRSEDSILKGNRRWRPKLPSAEEGEFTLPDLLRVADVL